MVLRDYEIEVKDRQISLEEDRAILTGKSTTTGYHRRDLSRVRILLALCLRFLVNRRHPSCFQKLGTHVENHDHRDRGQTQRDDRGYHNQGDVQGNWSRLNVCSNIFNVRSIVSYILSSDKINRVLNICLTCFEIFLFKLRFNTLILDIIIIIPLWIFLT